MSRAASAFPAGGAGAFLGGVVALAVLSIHGSALAGPVPKIVALIQTLPESAEASSISRELRRVAAEALYFRTLNLPDHDEIFYQGEDAPSLRVRTCGADTTCVADLLKEGNFDLGLRVLVNLEWNLVTLQLIDAPTRKVIGEGVLDYDASGNSSSVLAEMHRLLDVAGLKRGGRLQVQATPIDATVSVSDSLQRHESLHLVPAGAFEIRGSHPNSEDGCVSGLIAEAEEKRVDLVLVPRLLSEPGLLESPWFWTAVGGAVLIVSSSIFGEYGLGPRDAVRLFESARDALHHVRTVGIHPPKARLIH